MDHKITRVSIKRRKSYYLSTLGLSSLITDHLAKYPNMFDCKSIAFKGFQRFFTNFKDLYTFNIS